MKKRNLFIGIALVSVIFISIYLSNGGSIFEGGPAVPVPAAPRPVVPVSTTSRPVAGFVTKNITFNGTQYIIPSNIYESLKTVEQILNGTLKFTGDPGKEDALSKDFIEYNNDLTNNCKVYDNSSSTNPITKKPLYSIVVSEIPKDFYSAAVGYSYNDTFQVVYALTKVVASSSSFLASGDVKNVGPFCYMYCSFLSKLLANIKNVMNNTDTLSKEIGNTILTTILNSYSYTVTEEGPAPVLNKKNVPVTISFITSLGYALQCFTKIYQLGTGSWASTNGTTVTPYGFIICNYSGRPVKSEPAGVLNYSVNELQKNISILNAQNSNAPKPKDITSDAYFYQKLGVTNQPSTDYNSHFLPYSRICGPASPNTIFYTDDIKKLKTALSSLNKNPKESVNFPLWYTKQETKVTPYVP